MAPAGRVPRGAPWGHSAGGQSRAPRTDALPKAQVPGLHCVCPSPTLRGALPHPGGAFPSSRRAAPAPRAALIAPRGASSTPLHPPCPGGHCLLPGVHPPCPGSHHLPPRRAGGFGAPLPLLFPHLSALSQAPGLLPGPLLLSWSFLESPWSTRGFPLVPPQPRCARGRERPCAPRSLGPCQPQQAQPPQRSRRGTSPPTEKRGGRAPKPTPHTLLQPPEQRGTHPE